MNGFMDCRSVYEIQRLMLSRGHAEPSGEGTRPIPPIYELVTQTKYKAEFYQFMEMRGKK